MDDKKRIRKLKRQVKNLRALPVVRGEEELRANPELKGGAYMLGDHSPPRVEVVSYGAGGGGGGSSRAVVASHTGSSYVQYVGAPIRVSGLDEVKTEPAGSFTTMLNDAMKNYEDAIRGNLETPIWAMLAHRDARAHKKRSYRARHRRPSH